MPGFRHEFAGRVEQIPYSRGRSPLIEPHVLDGGADQDGPVAPRHEIARGSPEDVREGTRLPFQPQQLPADGTNVGPRWLAQADITGPAPRGDNHPPTV